MHAYRPAARVTALLLVAATGFVDLAVAQNSEATARAFLAKICRVGRHRRATAGAGSETRSCRSWWGPSFPTSPGTST